MTRLGLSLRLMIERIGRLFTRSIFPESSRGFMAFDPIPTRSLSQRERREASKVNRDERGSTNGE
jgi:hypothetical protein